MSNVISPDQRVKELGLALAEPLAIPPGVEAPLAMVVVRGKRCLISGHGPQNPDGSINEKLGQVGAELTLEEGIASAQLVALAILGTLQRELGSLDHINQWVRVFGMVNSAPGFGGQTPVINGFSKIILDVFGPERGLASRCAVGMAALPFGIPVEVEAEVELF